MTTGAVDPLFLSHFTTVNDGETIHVRNPPALWARRAAQPVNGRRSPMTPSPPPGCQVPLSQLILAKLSVLSGSNARMAWLRYIEAVRSEAVLPRRAVAPSPTSRGALCRAILARIGRANRAERGLRPRGRRRGKRGGNPLRAGNRGGHNAKRRIRMKWGVKTHGEPTE